MSATRLSPPQVRPIGLVLALAATILLVALFWIFERELLWMAGVLAAGIWTPIAMRSEDSARNWAPPALATGIVLLALAGLIVWIA